MVRTADLVGPGIVQGLDQFGAALTRGFLERRRVQEERQAREDAARAKTIADTRAQQHDLLTRQLDDMLGRGHARGARGAARPGAADDPDVFGRTGLSPQETQERLDAHRQQRQQETIARLFPNMSPERLADPLMAQALASMFSAGKLPQELEYALIAEPGQPMDDSPEARLAAMQSTLRDPAFRQLVDAHANVRGLPHLDWSPFGDPRAADMAMAQALDADPEAAPAPPQRESFWSSLFPPRDAPEEPEVAPDEAMAQALAADEEPRMPPDWRVIGPGEKYRMTPGLAEMGGEEFQGLWDSVRDNEVRSQMNEAFEALDPIAKEGLLHIMRDDGPAAAFGTLRARALGLTPDALSPQELSSFVADALDIPEAMLPRVGEVLEGLDNRERQAILGVLHRGGGEAFDLLSETLRKAVETRTSTAEWRARAAARKEEELRILRAPDSRRRPPLGSLPRGPSDLLMQDPPVLQTQASPF